MDITFYILYAYYSMSHMRAHVVCVLDLYKVGITVNDDKQY